MKTRHHEVIFSMCELGKFYQKEYIIVKSISISLFMKSLVQFEEVYLIITVLCQRKKQKKKK